MAPPLVAVRKAVDEGAESARSGAWTRYRGTPQSSPTQVTTHGRPPCRQAAEASAYYERETPNT